MGKWDSASWGSLCFPGGGLLGAAQTPDTIRQAVSGTGLRVVGFPAPCSPQSSGGPALGSPPPALPPADLPVPATCSADGQAVGSLPWAGPAWLGCVLAAPGLGPSVPEQDRTSEEMWWRTDPSSPPSGFRRAWSFGMPTQVPRASTKGEQKDLSKTHPLQTKVPLTTPPLTIHQHHLPLLSLHPCRLWESQGSLPCGEGCLLPLWSWERTHPRVFSFGEGELEHSLQMRSRKKPEVGRSSHEHV